MNNLVDSCAGGDKARLGACVRALLLLCYLGSPDLPAQESLRFGERVDVEVVDLEAVVLDRTGAPVTDLNQKDFTVLVNGTPAEIVDFSANFTTVPAIERTVPTLPSVPETVTREPNRANVWLVFVDLLRTGEFRRRIGVRAVRDFLESSVQPGDQVMAGFYDGAALRVLLPLTDNRDGVSKAFRSLDQRAMPSRLDLLGFQLDEDDKFQIESAAIRALRDFVALASGVRGRRRLLLVGGGYMLHGWENLERAARLQKQYEELRDALASSGITVYGVWAWKDGILDFGADAAFEPPIDGPAPELSPIGFGSTVATLANDTGGVPLVAVTGLHRLLNQAEQRLDGFYGLAIRTPPNAAGKRLDIRVRVARDDVRVQHRRLIRIASDIETVRQNNMAALLTQQPENPLNVRVRTGRGYRDRLRRSRAPLEVRVPIEGLLLVEKDGRHFGHLQFFVSVRDAKGNYTSVDPKALKLAVPNEEMPALRKNGIRYSLELIVSPGTTDVSLTVADVLARTHSTTRFQITSR